MTSRQRDADRAYLQKIFKGSSFFDGAASDDLEELARCARNVAIERGEPLKTTAGKLRDIYVIESGGIAAISGGKPAAAEKKPQPARGILVSVFGPGELVGLEDAFDEASQPETQHGKRPVEYQALTNLCAAMMPATDFLRVMRRSDALSAAALATLARRVSTVAARFSQTLQSPLELRLAAFISQLATITTGNSWEPTANIGRLAQAHIADMLGVSREHVNRTITMWERSGLIFQTKAGELLVENRKRLTGIASDRRASPATSHESEWLWEIDAHLDYGLNELAYNLATEAARRAPKDDRLKHRAALALARAGAREEAIALVAKLSRPGSGAIEDILALHARLLRDQALAGGRAPDTALLIKSAEEYEKGLRETGGYYSGVNAAATYAMAGETDRASKVAAEVVKIAETRISEFLDEDAPSYYARSSLAEARLIAGDKTAAHGEFKNALSAIDVTPGKKATTRKQLRRLKRVLSIDDAWIDSAVPQGAVLCYSGPLAADGEADIEPVRRLKENCHEFLSRHDIALSVGALAAGADIVIAEALLEAGISLNVVLPLPPKKFLDISVTPFGNEWRERFVRCIESATTIDWTRRVFPSRGAFRLGSKRAMGWAIRQAQELETSPIGLFAFQRDRTRETSVSLDNAEAWKGLGYEGAYFDDDWPEAAPPRPAAIEDEVYFALAIAGSANKKAKAELESAPIFEQVTDDLIVAGFQSAKEALTAAAGIAASAEGKKLRLWLDAGVYTARGKEGPPRFAPSLVTASCRPQTESGKAFASESFVAAAAACWAVDLRFDYVGYVALEDKLEPCPLYVLAK